MDLFANDFLAGFSLPDSPQFDDWQFFQQEELKSAARSEATGAGTASRSTESL